MERWPADGLNVAGQFKGEEIRGYLDTGYPADSENGVSGLFFFPRRWSPLQRGTEAALSMIGSLTPDCQLQLEDASGGVWRLRFVGENRLDGTVERSPGDTAPVSLTFAPPKDCSGRGPWRKFSSADWPVTFEYPASWRLAESEDGIVIECPDAGNLAWGGSAIRLRAGRGREAVVTEEGDHGTTVGTFVSFRPGEWLAGECRDGDEHTLFCNPARKSVWRGMTVLQGSGGENRHYRAGGGGYVGQGSFIMSYAFLLRGDRWVSIDSQDPPDSIDRMFSSGLVIFAGDGVTERLVRSIRPK